MARHRMCSSALDLNNKLGKVHCIHQWVRQRLLFQDKILFLSLKIVFVLANSVDPDEMQHSKAFHLGLHCL